MIACITDRIREIHVSMRNWENKAEAKVGHLLFPADCSNSLIMQLHITFILASLSRKGAYKIVDLRHRPRQ